MFLFPHGHVNGVALDPFQDIGHLPVFWLFVVLVPLYRWPDIHSKPVRQEFSHIHILPDLNLLHPLWGEWAGMLVNHSISDQLSFEDRIAMLNADQWRIFDTVDNHIQHQKQHETGERQCDFKPLRMFVSGVGGMGKSFLIETIKLLVGKIWPSKEVTVAIAASTGFAAFKV